MREIQEGQKGICARRCLSHCVFHSIWEGSGPYEKMGKGKTVADDTKHHQYGLQYGRTVHEFQPGNVTKRDDINYS